MFHILLLELTHLNILLQIIFYFEFDDQVEYKIKKIINKDAWGCYFVKWKKYLDFNNTWEPKKNL